MEVPGVLAAKPRPMERFAHGHPNREVVMTSSVFRFLWPQFFTAGARGTRDRRRGHPSPPAIIPARRHGDPSGETQASLPIFAITMITDAEVHTNRRMRRWEAKRSRLKSKAEGLGIEIQQLLTKKRLLSRSRDGRHDARDPGRELSKNAYAISLAVMGVAEYAINFSSFSSWFPASDSWSTFMAFGWQLYLAAALPSVLIPLFGHKIGSVLKHSRATRMKFNDGVMLFAVAGCSVGLLLAMANLRNLDLVSHAATAGTGAYWGLLAINLAALVAGATLSYASHSEDADHEDSNRQTDRLERVLRSKRKAWQRVAAAHDKHRAAAIHDVEAIQQGTLTRILEYADYNLIGANDTLSILPNGVDLHYFNLRNFSTELSRTPPTLTEIYDQGAGDGAHAPVAEAPPPSNLNGVRPPTIDGWNHSTAANGDDDARH